MSIPLIQVDAFTSAAFRGNPAAVCLLDAPRDEQWMLNVAAEMNLAETAFLVPRGEEFDLRWFTPAVEVALCGHATLGSAHVLWEQQVLSRDRAAVFHTKSGVLTARADGDWIELDFPAKEESAAEPPPELLPALGLSQTVHVGRNEFDYLVEVANEDELRALSPDHRLLRKLPVRGVIVTSKGSGEFDFISRFFAPGSGIDEDPVTGSAHCCLGPYWQKKTGQTSFLAYQASPRGGVVRVDVSEPGRVKLGGQAVTVMRGVLTI